MPTPQDNADEFDVGFSASVRKTLRSLQRQASREGRGAAFLSAMRAILDRLRTDPREAGEPFYPLPALRVYLRGIAIRPAYVDYAVHETERKVFIRSVKLFGLGPP
jgi:hypothetical protein